MVARGVIVYAMAVDFDDESRTAAMTLGEQPIDFKLARLGMNPMRDLVDIFRLIALLLILRPDATLGYFIKPVIYGTIAAWVARVPIIIAMIESLGYVFTMSDKVLS
jgi:UDP-N-acetylglucosamine:LPS N-acetylglucosamine transferase